MTDRSPLAPSYEVPQPEKRSSVSRGGRRRKPGRWRRMSSKAASLSPENGWFFTLGLVAAWCTSNIGVLLFNKYLLSNYGFKCPIFLTTCHMSACSLLSYVVVTCDLAQEINIVPMQPIRSRVQFLKISALSLVFCSSVVSGNVSLRYLPVSLNQAIGATSPFFTTVFAYLMTLRRELSITYITLVPVVTGVFGSGLNGESSFQLFSFIMCIGATAFRALKSVLQGILMSSEGEKLNSMNLLFMAPIAVVFLLPATIIMEEKWGSDYLSHPLLNSSSSYFVNQTYNSID